MLAAAGLDPTFVVGGRVNHAGSHAGVGKSEYMVVEADESDRSFLLLAPVVAVVTTIDREHLDQYKSLEEIQDVFLQFVNRVPFYGAVMLCLDEPNVQAILPRVKRPVITYGTSNQADLVISDVKLDGLASEFRLNYHGEDLGLFRLPSPPGIHNVRNAAAAAAVALSLNVPADLIRAGLAKFSGVGRRFEIKGVFNGVTLIDDYGHHPAEIRATLEAARGCDYQRLLVLFQPHRYTPHPASLGRFSALVQSSRRAGDLRNLCRGRTAHRRRHRREAGRSDQLRRATKTWSFTSTMQAGMDYMLREAQSGDAVLAIGAGSVGRVLDQLAMLLESKVSQRSSVGDKVSCVSATNRSQQSWQELGVELRPASRMIEKTSLGIGGTTDLLLLRKFETIPEMMRLLAAEGIPHHFLGGGTNVLIADGELSWVALHLPTSKPGMRVEGNTATVDAAADLGGMVTFCAKHDLGGMEGLIGVPGSVGGALRMNAGAYGTQIGPLCARSRAVSRRHRPNRNSARQ